MPPRLNRKGRFRTSELALFLSSNGLSLALDAAELRVEIERLSIENTYLKPLSEKQENTYYSAKFYAGGP